ncbi:MAG: hypothetical protein HY906_21610 [Deltaproteobacteria bacterium]|nr:hypothetical protein [Deltaproteobacteria bacterium]
MYSATADEFMREGEARGKAEGKAEALLAIFKGRGLAVASAHRRRVLACRNLKTLGRWIAAALTAPSVSAVLSAGNRSPRGTGGRRPRRSS